MSLNRAAGTQGAVFYVQILYSFICPAFRTYNIIAGQKSGIGDENILRIHRVNSIAVNVIGGVKVDTVYNRVAAFQKDNRPRAGLFNINIADDYIAARNKRYNCWSLPFASFKNIAVTILYADDSAASDYNVFTAFRIKQRFNPLLYSWIYV